MGKSESSRGHHGAIAGSGFGSLASRIPSLKNQLGMEAVELGGVLLLFAMASVASFPLSGRAIDRYGAPGTTGGHISVDFIAQEVSKVYPDAITNDDHGFLLINGQQLAKEDQFIRWKLTSESRTVDGRCAKIQRSRYILCF